ncbi:MAG: hypothetical protein H6Q73_3720, partial [Firmicutes bacterium]|nr:hypothetical protein [Bacillota bacterium]
NMDSSKFKLIYSAIYCQSKILKLLPKQAKVSFQTVCNCLVAIV